MAAITNWIKRPQINLFWGWIGALGALVLIGVYTMMQVFLKGLVITNLTDQVPWGLWITVDLSSIALAGGAFFLSALVYIVGIKRFRPAARLAVFIGLLGYSAALCTLLLDIGRPDRFYHPLIFWNTHSMLWEVTMCIVLYFSVLVMEVFPLVVSHPVFERWPRIRALADTVHRGAPALAFLGLFFSMLHQSSLGATYGVILARPVWFRPTLPLMFIASAMAAGPALMIALALVVGWLRGREVVARDILFDIGRISAFVLLVWLYMRFWDLMAGNYGYVPLRNGSAQVLFSGPLALSFWVWEIVLGGIVAAGLLLWGAAYRNSLALFVGAGFVVMGLVLNRWNTTMLGLTTPLSLNPSLSYNPTPTYTPALTEWLAAVGIVAGVALAFSLGMRYLPAFDANYVEEHH